MNELKEPLISKAIVDSYHRKLLRSIESDVVIVGAGPAGLTAASHVDATGNEAVAVEPLRTRNLLSPQLASAGSGEGPMDATAGEAFVVEQVAEAYPGLWVTGMAVCATSGGSRMGPIFGGMLLSGKRVAELVLEKR